MLRSLISPIGKSAVAVPGIIWKPMEGFALSGVGSITAGSREPAAYGLQAQNLLKLPRASFTISTALSY